MGGHGVNRRPNVTLATQWEAVALTLAARAGIATLEWRMEDVAGRAVLVLRRFERLNQRRIAFLSAISLLDAEDNEQRSYRKIADALRRYGAKPEEDCAQLWRRIVFSILIANTDDHLRNHGFLYDSTGGWRLSPACDHPVPLNVKPRILTTAVDEGDGTASCDLALGTAARYGLKPMRLEPSQARFAPVRFAPIRRVVISATDCRSAPVWSATTMLAGAKRFRMGQATNRFNRLRFFLFATAIPV
jgi:hypothetical protein